MSENFGLSAALATPFDVDGEITIPGVIEQAKHCLANGCKSVTLFGTTGEGASIGMQERKQVLAAMLAAGITPQQIVMGVLVDAAEDAAAQAGQALAQGVRNILLAPPSYFKNVSDDGLFKWFSAVFTMLGTHARDVIVYNIPSVTMVPLSISLVGRLRAAFPDVVVGVKDSSGDWPYTEELLKTHGDLIILIGDERHLARGVRLGGQGAISGMANLLPREVQAMAEKGIDDANVERFVGQLLNYPVIPSIKAILARLTENESWLAVRPPLVALNSQDSDTLFAAFGAQFRAKAA
ncbi:MULTISPECIES: dihydrodipicolinate synthase family protein [Rhizobium]|uniref:4-hydroxy-tetrahydrodipicolinate synthase n=1 Tax=Rhizobium tropici TaxID=398 RepID=A0A6P1C3A9_RHITR|nr:MULTISPECIES: dihydrodipicolinate synthase family protein [Rhizobium]AGB74515.1 dihydrodipicolinate synthase protein [Rhizobium tropici CIAT 899]MBB4242748.1 4-hydroxy-tetrahydrodipicolinate synthase [Rhizobium tropici]MBB5594347.1 4-hydroxy-tetrahydrodipicolinate synthase [Rhizobium tropici]MBB6493073.1 4-hydroxy-tetrahydrodipicolinate synthase [Rhizobium tropici]NEV10732.1 dihydrodipicolinate synthase family protein [Rhizobium tropici]